MRVLLKISELCHRKKNDQKQREIFLIDCQDFSIPFLNIEILSFSEMPPYSKGSSRLPGKNSWYFFSPYFVVVRTKVLFAFRHLVHDDVRFTIRVLRPFSRNFFPVFGFPVVAKLVMYVIHALEHSLSSSVKVIPSLEYFPS